MMRSVGVQRSRSLNRDRSTPSRPADANVDSAVAFDRIRLRSTVPKAGALTRLRYAPQSLLIDSKPDFISHAVRESMPTPIYGADCSKTVAKPIIVTLPVPNPPRWHGGSVFEGPLVSFAASSAST